MDFIKFPLHFVARECKYYPFTQDLSLKCPFYGSSTLFLLFRTFVCSYKSFCAENYFIFLFKSPLFPCLQVLLSIFCIIPPSSLPYTNTIILIADDIIHQYFWQTHSINWLGTVRLSILIHFKIKREVWMTN